MVLIIPPEPLHTFYVAQISVKCFSYNIKLLQHTLLQFEGKGVMPTARYEQAVCFSFL
jgi:hypothetical protein